MKHWVVIWYSTGSCGHIRQPFPRCKLFLKKFQFVLGAQRLRRAHSLEALASGYETLSGYETYLAMGLRLMKIVVLRENDRCAGLEAAEGMTKTRLNMLPHIFSTLNHNDLANVLKWLPLRRLSKSSERESWNRPGLRIVPPNLGRRREGGSSIAGLTSGGSGAGGPSQWRVARVPPGAPLFAPNSEIPRIFRRGIGSLGGPRPTFSVWNGFGKICSGRQLTGGDGKGLVLFLLWLSLATGWSQLPDPGRTAPAPVEFREDRILVKPKPGVTRATLGSFHAAQRGEVMRTFEGIGNLQLVRLPRGETVRGLIQKYEQSGLVAYAEPDYRILLAGNPPNDPRYLDGTLWGLNNTGQSGGTVDADIDAPEGWEVLAAASDIVVAVLDTGVRYTHEDLAANMWVNPQDGSHGLNVLNGTNDPNDDNGHGTRVAGILGAVGNNGKGVAGMAWRVQIMACKFMTGGSISDAITCIEYARTNGAKIINASWGLYAESLSLSNAIYGARQAGIIFVAAAGNDKLDNDALLRFYPASYDLDNIVAVAATSRTDELVSYSNFGATNVDLAAPGTNIYSTDFLSDNAYFEDEGTSMAAPYVTGAFALMRAKYPNETHQQIISRVLAATDPLPALAGKCLTAGRLNLRKALGPPLVLTPIPPTGATPFRLQLSGDPYRTYVIQLNTNNLLSWTPVFTNSTGANGGFVFTDAPPANAARRFFRAVSSP